MFLRGSRTSGVQLNFPEEAGISTEKDNFTQVTNTWVIIL